MLKRVGLMRKVDAMFDPSKLTAEPWEAQNCAIRMPSIQGGKSGLYIVCDAHNGRHDAARADAEFIALARNAFEIKMRRKWFAVPCPAGWVAARMFPDVEHDNSANWTWAIPQVIPCGDPETAIVEAEAWALAHPEEFKKYDDWQNNVAKESRP